MIKKAIEYFIPDVLRQGTEYQRRTTLVGYTIFITGAFALFYVGVSWIAEYETGAFIMLASTVGYLILLLLIKNKVNAFIIANIYGFIGALSIYGCIYFSGGFQSPVLPWLASTPIVILLIAGKKSGYFWAVISLIIIITLGIMHYTGFVFPKKYSPATEPFFFLSCHTGLVMIIFLISMIFENFRFWAFNAVNNQKEELQMTLAELKATQAQLIQSEKMASLGELTAGIAHEIQNPLNFVNNFSEVNTELIDELKSELTTGNMQQAIEIADDIKENEQKISHHGKRADAIVKGMLQHSRSNNGQKEPTDINALADEYLRLAYHGLRAKDNSFNATLQTDYDESIGNINIVPQDIGRVILNLITNAFYAVNERTQKAKALSETTYEPSIVVSTKNLEDRIQISIKDNGGGISKNVLDKIFQPFFTTKPTGEGTGLGLSLSYDIITKGHGGDITVKTKDGEGAEFIINIPVK